MRDSRGWPISICLDHAYLAQASNQRPNRRFINPTARIRQFGTQLSNLDWPPMIQTFDQMLKVDFRQFSLQLGQIVLGSVAVMCHTKWEVLPEAGCRAQTTSEDLENVQLL